MLLPFIDTSVNAKWDDWVHYPNGRPNPIYSEQAKSYGVDGLIFGFITLSATNKACWAAQDTMTLDWSLPLAREIKPLKTIISFGGASNPDISYKFSIEELIQTYSKTLSMYDAYGLDFDLENGLFNIDKICKALQKLEGKPNLSFTLPVMPAFGLTGKGLEIIQKAKDHDLDFVVNGMAMDYYNAEDDEDMGLSAIKAAEAIKKQLDKLYNTNVPYSRVGITPMIGLNDDVQGMFKIKDALQVKEYAAQKNLGIKSFWSFNRDNPSDYSYVDLTTSSNPEQKVSGEYTLNLV